MYMVDTIRTTAGPSANVLDNSTNKRKEQTKMSWIRTCQECGKTTKRFREPGDKGMSDSYRDGTCQRCHSPALDYGRLEMKPCPSPTCEEDGEDCAECSGFEEVPA